jgi:phosphoribosylformylglycinamidine synthase subunit PurL
LEDVDRHATPGFKRKGDLVVVIGGKPPVSLDGSEYLEIVHGRVAGRPPRPDLGAGKEIADLVRGMVCSGLVDTAHDISGGGEIVAVAEMALAGGLGIEYERGELERMTAGWGGGRADVALFGEGSGAFVVAVPEERWNGLQDVLVGVPYEAVGTTGGNRFKIGNLIDVRLSDLREAYERDLFERYAPEGGHIG